MTRRLQRLAHAAQAWSRGDFSVAIEDASRDEIGQLARGLNRMAEQLHNLMQARQELARLDARNRLARDLHDSVKQQVFATALQIGAARSLIQSDQQAAEAHLDQASSLMRQAQQELNTLIHEMRPSALEGKELAAALRTYVLGWSKQNGISAEVRVRGERETPFEVEQALFRVAQEALANVARHSGATTAEVDLAWDGDGLALRITDNGRGFVHEEGSGKGFGLESMRERVEALGGSFDASSKPGCGTQILCALGGAPARDGEA